MTAVTTSFSVSLTRRHGSFAFDVRPGPDPRRPQRQRDEPGGRDHDARPARRPPRPVRQRSGDRKVSVVVPSIENQTKQNKQSKTKKGIIK